MHSVQSCFATFNEVRRICSVKRGLWTLADIGVFEAGMYESWDVVGEGHFPVGKGGSWGVRVYDEGPESCPFPSRYGYVLFLPLFLKAK